MPNDAIFDDNDLKTAAQLVAGSMLSSLPSRAECEHEFSDDFTAKMDKLLHRQKRQIWYTVIRYAAVIVLTATLALGTVMAASPTARAAVLKWTRELYDAGNGLPLLLGGVRRSPTRIRVRAAAGGLRGDFGLPQRFILPCDVLKRRDWQVLRF